MKYLNKESTQTNTTLQTIPNIIFNQLTNITPTTDKSTGIKVNGHDP